MVYQRPLTKPGVTYWVEVDGVRIKLKAVEKSVSIPGWWICTAPMGTEIIVKEADILERAVEQDSPLGS